MESTKILFQLFHIFMHFSSHRVELSESCTAKLLHVFLILRTCELLTQYLLSFISEMNLYYYLFTSENISFAKADYS